MFSDAIKFDIVYTRDENNIIHNNINKITKKFILSCIPHVVSNILFNESEINVRYDSDNTYSLPFFIYATFTKL